MRYAIVTCVLTWASLAQAFCGFYVGSTADPLVNTASQVVLLREGDRTALSMQNDYRGPPKDFALVVPVPVVVQQADVKTLPAQVFQRIDRLSAPRLVAYWEEDPCLKPATGGLGLGSVGVGAGGSGYGRGSGSAQPAVRVRAQFAVGEYDVVVLDAGDSAALDTWLRAREYNIPAGAEAALRPYVAAGMKFFVAKVNPSKVRFGDDGRAVLSPLRVTYRSPDLRLPVRLGRLNAQGAQDLVVHVLARDHRYEAANYPNATIPTNLTVTPEVQARFGQFYAALFDETLRRNPGAVITEYAWQSGKCDPCPGPVLSAQDLATFGAEIDAPAAAARSGVRLQVSATTVEGGLPDAVVRRVMRRHRNQVRFCVERALQGGAVGPQAGLTADFQIGAKGQVQGDPVVVGEGLPEAATTCAGRMVRRLRFPAPKGGGPATVRVAWAARPGPARTSRRGSRVANRYVLTRLHSRYDDAALGEDLVFRPAKPIVGGREVWVPGKRPKPKAKAKPKAKQGKDGALQALLGQQGGFGVTFGGGLSGGGIGLGGLGGRRSTQGMTLERGATPGGLNAFQGRYAIRHRWTGPVACEAPLYGVWGGPPKGSAGGATRTAAGLPPQRVPIDLSAVVPGGVPELGVPARP